MSDIVLWAVLLSIFFLGGALELTSVIRRAQQGASHDREESTGWSRRTWLRWAVLIAVVLTTVLIAR